LIGLCVEEGKALGGNTREGTLILFDRDLHHFICILQISDYNGGDYISYLILDGDTLRRKVDMFYLQWKGRLDATSSILIIDLF
jgi:hypothetical protein